MSFQKLNPDGSKFHPSTTIINIYISFQKLNPDGTCDSGPLGLPKPCSLINLATGVATG